MGVMYQEQGIWATSSCNLCAFTDWWVQSVHIPLPFDHGVSATTWANFVSRQVRQHQVDDESSSRMVFSELMVKCSVATKCYFSKWGWLSSENSKISSQYPKGLCWDSPIRAAKVSKQHLHLLLTLQDPSDLLGHRVQMQEQPGPEESSLFFFQALYNTRGFSCHSSKYTRMAHPKEEYVPSIQKSKPMYNLHPCHQYHIMPFS